MSLPTSSCECVASGRCGLHWAWGPWAQHRRATASATAGRADLARPCVEWIVGCHLLLPCMHAGLSLPTSCSSGCLHPPTHPSECPPPPHCQPGASMHSSFTALPLPATAARPASAAAAEVSLPADLQHPARPRPWQLSLPTRRCRHLFCRLNLRPAGLPPPSGASTLWARCLRAAPTTPSKRCRPDTRPSPWRSAPAPSCATVSQEEATATAAATS